MKKLSLIVLNSIVLLLLVSCGEKKVEMYKMILTNMYEYSIYLLNNKCKFLPLK